MFIHFTLVHQIRTFLGIACFTLSFGPQSLFAQHIVHRDVTPGPLVQLGQDGTLHYAPFTNRGDQIMDYSYAGYQASEEPIPTVEAKLTLGPLPNSPAPIRTQAPPINVRADNSPKVLMIDGKKTFHKANCRRFARHKAKDPTKVTETTYRLGRLSGMDYCSRCKLKPGDRVTIDEQSVGVKMAYPSGPNSAAGIQAAIDEVAGLPADEQGFKGAVLLKRGTYYLKERLHLKTGVVLRGEGDSETGTVLVFHVPDGTGITMGDGVKPVELEVTSRVTDEYVPVGSNRFSIQDPDGFAVGDMIHVTKTTNAAWVSTLGMNKGLEKPWKPEAYQLKHLREIKAIEGNTITLDVPLPDGLVKEYGGGSITKVELPPETQFNMGVEHVRIISNYNANARSMLRSRTGGFYEADEEENMRVGIRIGGMNCWVRNCTILHPARKAVTAHYAQFATIKDVKSLQPVSIIKGARRYAFDNNDSSKILFLRCHSEFGRHDFVTGSRDGGPISFVRGTVYKGGLSETHQRWASGVLYDNITIKDIGGLGSFNRGNMGSGQGWSGVNVVMWNCVAPSIKIANPPTPGQNFAIGSKVTQGNGVSGNGFVYSQGKHVQPQSLFEQQLIDRIGKEQARNVLE